MWLLNAVSIFLFSLVKILSRLFFRIDAHWLKADTEGNWAHDVKLFIFLNHTSLFEPLFVGAVPFSFIFWGAPRIVVPGADKTLKRPIVGTFFKFLCPRMISITRKRDETWDEFLSVVEPNSMVIILPEGRMKRRNGLDLNGEPMSIRGGVFDILEKIPEGRMIIAYSGGLHHVQAPGEWVVHLFKPIRIAFESVSISEYKRAFPKKMDVVKDLSERLREHCPVEYGQS